MIVVYCCSQIPEEMSGFMSCVILPCSDPAVLESMQKHLFAAHQLSYVYSHVPASSTAEGSDNNANAASTDSVLHTVFTGATQLATAAAALTVNSESGSAAAQQQAIYFVRISAQVYLELVDFELLGRKVTEYLKNHRLNSVRLATLAEK